MAFDPLSIIISISANLATEIIKHYAQRFNGTAVGRRLVQVGISESTRDDHLRQVLQEALQLYFETYPLYDVSGVIEFFHDPLTIQQIGDYIFDRKQVDQQALGKSLFQHLKNDPLTVMLLRKRGVQPDQIIPNFLTCYREVLNRHTDAAERAILLAVLDATDAVIKEMDASEERLKATVIESVGSSAARIQYKIAIPPLAPGQIVGRYRIQRQLAVGTFGTYYLAEELDTKLQVVLKIVDAPDGLRLGYDIFSLGSRLLNLSHPSILPTLAIHLDSIPLYVVTAYAPGGSLFERIRRSRQQPLSLADALAIVSKVGNGLAYLHSQRVLHRSVQPASIMFDNMGNALLTGFDLAIMAGSIRHRLQSNLIGAVHYMAPEQLQGISSEKSDQYALGCIAYELCTDRLPFKGSTLGAMLQGRSKPPIAPRMINHELPTQTERAILKAISVNPDQRFHDVLAFVTALGS